jgi:hypothetical protein
MVGMAASSRANGRRHRPEDQDSRTPERDREREPHQHRLADIRQDPEPCHRAGGDSSTLKRFIPLGSTAGPFPLSQGSAVGALLFLLGTAEGFYMRFGTPSVSVR